MKIIKCYNFCVYDIVIAIRLIIITPFKTSLFSASYVR